ncbi:MAG: hypothetical protein QGI70_14525, partial [Paracoccaceae bacterium]|nr:hypothetical protein [Paracoccaceae bacterium]
FPFSKHQQAPDGCFRVTRNLVDQMTNTRIPQAGIREMPLYKGATHRPQGFIQEILGFYGLWGWEELRRSAIVVPSLLIS